MMDVSTMDGGDVNVAGAGVTVTVAGQQLQQQRIVSATMRLHMVRGSFLGDGGVSMDAEVWSMMPDELMWEVLLLVPADAHFRLQAVSRQWRRVLTSAAFRSQVVAAARERRRRRGWRQQQQERQGVIACVSSRRTSSDNESEEVPPANSKVVDMDLCSFLPTWFWRFTCCYPYSVVAAANGLVCISNSNGADDREEEHTLDCCHHHEGLPEGELQPPPAAAATSGNKCYHYAVLNPLNRTCTVLPPVPFTPKAWLPPTPAGAVTILGYMTDPDADLDGDADGSWRRPARDRYRGEQVHVATCDFRLAASSSSAAAPAATAARGRTGRSSLRWDLAAYKLRGRHGRVFRRESDVPAAVQLCGGGESFWYYGRQVHVVAAPGGTFGRAGAARAATQLAEVAVLNEPPVALLGLDSRSSRLLHPLELRSAYGYDHPPQQSRLVAHRGAVYLVQTLLLLFEKPEPELWAPAPDLVVGVWRLVRRQWLQWEGVASLRVAELLQRRLAPGARVPWLPRHTGNTTSSSSTGGVRVARPSWRLVHLTGATGVREFVCCRFVVNGVWVVEIGLNLETGEWELLHDDVKRAPDDSTLMVELRPDLFLWQPCPALSGFMTALPDLT